MGEVGCLKDGHFQNLQSETSNIFNTSISSSVSTFSGTSTSGLTKVIFGKNTEGADPYTESVTQQFPLGTELVYGERRYRYAKAGAVNLTPGTLQQASANSATNASGGHHINMGLTTGTTAGAGVREISIETAKIAFAPSFFFSSVESKSIKILSIFF